MCRMCHIPHSYLYCQLWLTRRLRISRDIIRTREIWNTSHRKMDLKWMGFVVVGLHMPYICATNPYKKTTLVSHSCTLKFLILFKACMTDSMSVTLKTKSAYTYFTNNLKILRCRYCEMLVGGGLQRIFFSVRQQIQNHDLVR